MPNTIAVFVRYIVMKNRFAVMRFQIGLSSVVILWKTKRNNNTTTHSVLLAKGAADHRAPMLIL